MLLNEHTRPFVVHVDISEPQQTQFRHRDAATKEERDDRCIPALELAPGMVLSRDLVSPQGTLLLAAGYVFDARVVRQVREYAQREGARLTLHVRRETVAAPHP